MAIEDAQYAINVLSKKIADTGYPPKEMAGYNVMVNDGREVWIYFTPPANTYLAGFSQNALPLVEVGGVMIRKKHGSPITSVNDGDLLVKIPAEDMYNYRVSPYVDQDVIADERYYYRFFPYSTNGRFNTQANDQKGVVIAKEWESLIFGFDQDFTDLNPETQFSYPNDVENSNYTPMIVNPNRGTPTVGGWSYFIQRVLKNAPYMVKRNGEVDYALDPNNYAYKVDNTPSDAYNTEYQGGAFSWLEAVYTREWYTTGKQMSLESGNVRHVRYTATIPQGEDEGHVDYIPATGTYVSGTTYYTDETGGAEVDTTGFTPGVTDVSSYYVAFVTQWEKVSCSWRGTTSDTAAKGVFIPMGVGDSSNGSNLSIKIDATQTVVHSDAVVSYATNFLSEGALSIGDGYGGSLDSYIRDLLCMMGKTGNIRGADGAFDDCKFGSVVTVGDVSDVYPGFYCDGQGEYATRAFHSFMPLAVEYWQDPHKCLNLNAATISSYRSTTSISNIKYTEFARSNDIKLEEVSLPDISFSANTMLKDTVCISKMKSTNIGVKTLTGNASSCTSLIGLKTSIKIQSKSNGLSNYNWAVRDGVGYDYGGTLDKSGNDNVYGAIHTAYDTDNYCTINNGYKVYIDNLTRRVPVVIHVDANGSLICEIMCEYIVKTDFGDMPKSDFIRYPITLNKDIRASGGLRYISYPLGFKPVSSHNNNINYSIFIIPEKDYTPY